MNREKVSQELSPSDKHLIYAFSHVQAWLEVYALRKQIQIPFDDFAFRVGRLLGAEGERNQDPVPIVPGGPAQVAEDERPETKMAVGARLHVPHPEGGKAKRILSPAGKRAVKKAQAKRWAKYRKEKKAAAKAIKAEVKKKSKKANTKKYKHLEKPSKKSSHTSSLLASSQSGWWHRHFPTKKARAEEMARRAGVRKANKAALEQPIQATA